MWAYFLIILSTILCFQKRQISQGMIWNNSFLRQTSTYGTADACTATEGDYTVIVAEHNLKNDYL